ncbi:metal-dependent hydrolase [Aliterella atlantica]|uniref:Hydrolase n=1 Tax=Aliterella atlantica CENA595 TaxID=1618023 RepID=A0A0D8ZPJ6_9CYAN|nr:metal-dependent hydrolase [Aliterella atlantica]KJH70257.1 hypothetical protein UH38_19100 [Aliterella atlantica CENA595]
MMSITHAVAAVAMTSLTLGTADPIILGISAISSQLPDADTSKSVPGRILFPLSHYLEKRYPHRSISHSFLAWAVISAVTIPISFVSHQYWLAISLGYLFGFISDCFTKSGVTAFYPSKARLVIPGNPRLRLSTGSGAEYFILIILVAIAITSINISSSGGILKAFNQVLAMPSGAVEVTNEEINNYLIVAHIKGRNALTQESIEGDYEVVKSLTQTDLLVKDNQGRLYRAGSSQECQIATNQVRIYRGARVRAVAQEIQLESDDISTAFAVLPLSPRTYISGVITLEDAEDLAIATRPDRFNALTLQPGAGVAIIHLESASPQEIISKLGDYFATGTLIVRSIYV